MSRICIFGDSIACGHNDYSKGGWAELLRIYFPNNYDDVSVYNCSISGDTTNEIVSRFDVEYKSRNPEVILFAIGINDSAFLNKKKSKNMVNAAVFQKNLNLLFSKARKKSKALFIGLTGVDESKTMPISWRRGIYYSNDVIEKYNTIIQKFCREKSIPFLELKDILGIKDLDDGLHPNSQGHAKIFRKVKQFLIDEKIV